MKFEDPIPVYEPEVVRSIANKHYRGSDEKVSTTAIRNLRVGHVRVESRYNKAVELETMRAMILALPAGAVSCVRSIWCNSKISRCYTIGITPWEPHQARAIAERLERVALGRDGGHNGIWVEPDNKSLTDERQIELSANWGDEL